jgi:hypothetical protein
LRQREGNIFPDTFHLSDQISNHFLITEQLFDPTICVDMIRELDLEFRFAP